MLAVPAHEGLRSARLGGTSSLGYRRAPGACRPVVNGWFGQVAIAGRGPRSGASHRSASLSRPCALQQGWRRSVVWVSSEQPKRAAVAQLRQVSLVCASACAVEALPSSQTAEQPASRTAAVQDEQTRAPCRRPVLGRKYRTKNDFPENACGFVELIPGPHHHAKGSCWAHSGGRWERLLNTFRTDVVHTPIHLSPCF